MKKLSIISFLLLIGGYGFGQGIFIGSGLNNDTLIVTNFSDTIFNDVVTSRDEVDVFTVIPINKRKNGYTFYINGWRVSYIYIDDKILMKKSRVYLDFHRVSVDEISKLIGVDYKNLLGVDYKIIK